MPFKASSSSHLPGDNIVSKAATAEFDNNYAASFGIEPTTRCRCGHAFSQHSVAPGGVMNSCHADADPAAYRRPDAEECACLNFRKAD
jgi:hypothetical protein